MFCISCLIALLLFICCHILQVLDDHYPENWSYCRWHWQQRWEIVRCIFWSMCYRNHCREIQVTWKAIFTLSWIWRGYQLCSCYVTIDESSACISSFVEADITYDESRHFPYTFNVTAFDDITMQMDGSMPDPYNTSDWVCLFPLFPEDDWTV